MEYLAQHIESLIFTTEHAISFDEIKSCLEDTFETTFKQQDIEEALAFLKDRYQKEAFAFEMIELPRDTSF